MLKRAGPSLDVAAIAFLAPDLASSLVHVAYLGERLGRCQRPPVFLTSKLNPMLYCAPRRAWRGRGATVPSRNPSSGSTNWQLDRAPITALARLVSEACLCARGGVGFPIGFG